MLWATTVIVVAAAVTVVSPDLAQATAPNLLHNQHLFQKTRPADYSNFLAFHNASIPRINMPRRTIIHSF